MGKIRVLAFGDVVGRPGREALKANLATLEREFPYDLLLINAENAAGGRGINARVADEIFQLGTDVITLGDHTWDQSDVGKYLDKNKEKIIRPANFNDSLPGAGFTKLEINNHKIGVINLIGRVFTGGLYDCPFKTVQRIISQDLQDCSIKIVDFHAEATSEKCALARYLDGQVSLVFGTHTHVQTADETILPEGTAYITDLGMCGSYDHVIGLKTDVAIARFLGEHRSYNIGKGNGKVAGIYAEIEAENGKASSIVRILNPN